MSGKKGSGRGRDEPATSSGILAADAAVFERLAQRVSILKPRRRTDAPFRERNPCVGGKVVLNGAGLDYLGLSGDKMVRSIFHRALDACDPSSPASRLITDSSEAVELEQELFSYHFPGRSGTSVLFLSGFPANFSTAEAFGLRLDAGLLRSYQDDIACMRAYVAAPTIFFIDKEWHLSGQHGVRFASFLGGDERCRYVRFPTRDYGALDALLRASFDRFGDCAVRIVALDALSSTSGVKADIAALYEVVARYDNVIVWLDEAHSVYVLGPQGRGVAAEWDRFTDHAGRTLITGTLTKAFCSLGGYVTLPDKRLGDMVRFASPGYMFAAPLPPWLCHANIRILELLRGPFGDGRRAALARISRFVRSRLLAAGFSVPAGAVDHLVPLPMSRPKVAQEALRFLLSGIGDRGLIPSFFEVPVVPRGEEMFRISMRADMTKEDVDDFVRLLVAARDRFKF